MKQSAVWLLTAVLLAAAVLPDRGTDAAQLLPVQVLLVERAEDGTLAISCDAQLCGRGADLDAALEDLRAGAPGQLFLQTAGQVIFTRQALSALPQAAQCGQLRPGAQVFVLAGQTPDLEDAAAFLQAHPGGVTLGDVRAMLAGAGDVTLPVLVSAKRRMEVCA